MTDADEIMLRVNSVRVATATQNVIRALEAIVAESFDGFLFTVGAPDSVVNLPEAVARLHERKRLNANSHGPLTFRLQRHEGGDCFFEIVSLEDNSFIRIIYRCIMATINKAV